MTSNEEIQETTADPRLLFSLLPILQAAFFFGVLRCAFGCIGGWGGGGDLQGLARHGGSGCPFPTVWEILGCNATTKDLASLHLER